MSLAAPDSTRRALLRGRAPAAMTMRPPWALAEDAFLAACTRCGDCVRLCPESILGKGDGGFPQVLAGAGECMFCKACVENCAPQALRMQGAKAWQWQAEVSEHCLGAAGVVCQICRDACPESAISFARAAPTQAARIDAEKCSACGACVAPCPTGAIALRAKHA